MTDTFTPTTEQIDAVHEWQARQLRDRVVRPIVPVLKEAFGVTASQAIAIIRAANEGGAHAEAS